MRAIMLIHGYITSPSDFNPLYESLSNMYDYVMKITLPGHGKNDKYKNFKFKETIDLLERSYKFLMNKYDEIDLIGFSLGGSLASFLSSKYKFEKVVLLSPANKYLRFGFILKYLKKHSMLKKRYKILKKKKDPRAYSYLKLANETKTNNKKAFKMGIFQLFPHYTIHTLHVFTKLIKYCNKNLKINNTKCLILWGELDQLVPFRSIKYLESFFCNSKVIIYDDITHLMLSSVNCNKIVNDVIGFLK